MKIEKVFKVAKLDDGNLIAIKCDKDFDFKYLLRHLKIGYKEIYITENETKEVKKGLEYFEFLVNGD